MGVLGDLGIGGMNIDARGMVSNIIVGILVMGFMGLAIFMVFMWVKNKKIYTYKVGLIMVKENGSHKRRDDLKGGIIKGKNGIKDFSIRIPKQFKKRLLGYIPDFSLATADDKLIFITSGDAMVWQQCREEVLTTEKVKVEIEVDGKKVIKEVDSNLIVEPIPIDIKNVTINNIHAAEGLLDTNKLKAATIAIGAFVLMVLVQIIFLFLTSKK